MGRLCALCRPHVWAGTFTWAGRVCFLALAPPPCAVPDTGEGEIVVLPGSLRYLLVSNPILTPLPTEVGRQQVISLQHEDHVKRS